MKIAFDVDGTLILPSITSNGFDSEIPNYEIIEVFRFFQKQGHEMFIWSGGGIDYAIEWSDKLGLKATIIEKEKRDDIDIAFDDQLVDLAKVNIKLNKSMLIKLP
jgi:hypothetical protein